MAEAMGVDMARVYARVFTLGVALGAVGGALVIPATAAVNEMGIDVIVEAFAVVVIGGLGNVTPGELPGGLGMARATLSNRASSGVPLATTRLFIWYMPV